MLLGLYAGTTIVSYILSFLTGIEIKDAIVNKGYKLKEKKVSLPRKILDLSVWLIIESIPVYNIINTLYSIVTLDKLVDKIEKKSLENGDIYKEENINEIKEELEEPQEEKIESNAEILSNLKVSLITGRDRFILETLKPSEVDEGAITIVTAGDDKKILLEYDSKNEVWHFPGKVRNPYNTIEQTAVYAALRTGSFVNNLVEPVGETVITNYLSDRNNPICHAQVFTTRLMGYDCDSIKESQTKVFDIDDLPDNFEDYKILEMYKEYLSKKEKQRKF